ncbi:MULTISPECIES: CAP domain-containing protein [unclassified Flavobacterium]|uniref:CAP domain-containing protein n=1 Tax=unclassified Flavobacterium TaxID=196869 RepID=UPI00057C6EA7|nr:MULTISPECIES: CAP domain-containing protein [unclassified Flavobacterium]KIA92217.1 Allergen V5/Tpx-1 family protein [Flavobacterium sp. KMS]OUL60467.1 hypothetical protein B8T70_20280 [Flavobacterium sp. AJR]
MVNFLYKIAIIIGIINLTLSCTTNSDNQQNSDAIYKPAMNYNYNSIELETMNQINEYRNSIGLNALDTINHVSFKSEEHNNYMIDKNVISHDNFVNRSENIIKVVDAKKVSENVAYNYNSPQGVLEAWLNSPGHKKNIEGDYTHFGISVRKHPINGRKYYTNIFVKL